MEATLGSSLARMGWRIAAGESPEEAALRTASEVRSSEKKGGTALLGAGLVGAAAATALAIAYIAKSGKIEDARKWASFIAKMDKREAELARKALPFGAIEQPAAETQLSLPWGSVIEQPAAKEPLMLEGQKAIGRGSTRLALEAAKVSLTRAEKDQVFTAAEAALRTIEKLKESGFKLTDEQVLNIWERLTKAERPAKTAAEIVKELKGAKK